MTGLASKLLPSTSALFVLVRHATPDKVIAGIAAYGGTVLQSSLSHDDEGKLQAALTHGKTPSAQTPNAIATSVAAAGF